MIFKFEQQIQQKFTFKSYQLKLKMKALRNKQFLIRQFEAEVGRERFSVFLKGKRVVFKSLSVSLP